MTRKKNPRIGSSLEDWIADESHRDPGFLAGLELEFNRLQLARELRALRQKSRLTQAQLAARIGTRQPAVARMEAGRLTPSLDVLERIAVAVGRRLEIRFAPRRAASHG